ncbi:MAG: transposase [Pseudomonadota bacterium]
MSKRKTYSAEFKRQAVELLFNSGRGASEIARELGVRSNQLYKWRDTIQAKGDGAFPGKGRQGDKDAEIARLRRQLEQVSEERDILKKAAAYFAKELE